MNENPNFIVPTAPPGTSNNQAASTAFVLANSISISDGLAAIFPPLTGDATLYVNADTGSDANPGTPVAPFQTINKAWNVLCTLNLNGFNAIVQLQDSVAHFAGLEIDNTVTGTSNTPIGNGFIYIQGNPADATKCVIGEDPDGICLDIGLPILCPVIVRDVTLTASNYYAWLNSPSSTIIIGEVGHNVILGSVGGGASLAAGTGFLSVVAGSRSSLAGNITLNPGAAVHPQFVQVANGAVFNYVGASFTIIGNPTFTNAFLSIASQGTILWRGVGTLTGTVNAKSYSIGPGGYLQISGAIAIPGTNGQMSPGSLNDALIAGVTVANLPLAASKGVRMFVTDATVTTFASIVAGGGANNVPVVWNGTNWIIG